MKQIIVFSPDEADGCSFYRGLGVLGELHRQDILIRRSPRYINWSELCDCDIGFMQRPFSTKHVEVAKMIKQQMPLWLDYDDDLFNIPECNPTYELYSRNEVLESLEQLKLLADVITVSTQGVQKSFGGVIIPNAYNDYRLPVTFCGKENKKPIVLWRGTESHVGDLLAFKNQLNDLIHSTDAKFVFLGFNPWILDTLDRDVVYIPSRDIYSYHQILEVINPDVLIVPLIDDKLNRAKSNIAWLETARFGTRSVVRAWPEWHVPNTYIYSSNQEFLPAFKDAFLTKTNGSAWEYVQNNLFLSQVNKNRLEIIQTLLS